MSVYELNLIAPSPITLAVGASGGGGAALSRTVDVIVTAQASLNAYRAITYEGLFTQPTVNSLSNYAGVSLVATTIGNPVTLIRSGLITEASWAWTTNAPLFITTDGVLTQTPPSGYIRRIGWALSPTQINLDPYPIIAGV